jgi:hypothetical protein
LLGNPDLSVIADRVTGPTWSLIQRFKSRTHSVRGITTRVEYEKQTHEAGIKFYYERHILFRLHARGEEITLTFFADPKSRARIADDQTIDTDLREQIKNKPSSTFRIQSAKDFKPIMELVRLRIRLFNEEGAQQEERLQERPIAV